MSNIIALKNTESIGNTLSTVNNNYFNLELNTLSIQNDIEKYWNPVINYYLDFQKFLKETTSIAQSYSSMFIGTSTTVEANSSSWIKPITIFFPSIFPDSIESDSIVDTLSSWIIEYFPETSFSEYDEITDSFNQVSNYVENQELIVYAHRWKYGSSISDNTLLIDYAFCQTSDKQVCVTCTNRYSGYVRCGNGDFNCSGQSNSCPQCKTLSCFYNSPPYNVYVPPPTRTLRAVDHYSNRPEIIRVPVYNKKGKIKKYIKKVITKIIRWTTNEWTVVANPSPNAQNSYGSIRANVEMTFQDRSEEENIFSAVFKIKNCSWRFDRFLQ